MLLVLAVRLQAGIRRLGVAGSTIAAKRTVVHCVVSPGRAGIDKLERFGQLDGILREAGKILPEIGMRELEAGLESGLQRGRPDSGQNMVDGHLLIGLYDPSKSVSEKYRALRDEEILHPRLCVPIRHVHAERGLYDRFERRLVDGVLALIHLDLQERPKCTWRESIHYLKSLMRSNSIADSR